MSRTHRPDLEELSRLLDGDLDASASSALESHLAGCAECRAELEALRDLVARTRTLEDQPPERDPWPAIAARLAPRGRPRVLLPLVAFAAGVLVTLALATALGGGPAEERVAGGRYLLLLHQPAGADRQLTPAEHAAIVTRYRDWADGLGAACLDGEELAGERWDLRADSPPVGVLEPAMVASTPASEELGGFFVVSASDPGEALRLARDCPHLELGGWIEVRRVNTNP
jgi:hypothetical protein